MCNAFLEFEGGAIREFDQNQRFILNQKRAILLLEHFQYMVERFRWLEEAALGLGPSPARQFFWNIRYRLLLQKHRYVHVSSTE